MSMTFHNWVRKFRDLCLTQQFDNVSLTVRGVKIQISKYIVTTRNPRPGTHLGTASRQSLQSCRGLRRSRIVIGSIQTFISYRIARCHSVRVVGVFPVIATSRFGRRDTRAVNVHQCRIIHFSYIRIFVFMQSRHTTAARSSVCFIITIISNYFFRRDDPRKKNNDEE